MKCKEDEYSKEEVEEVVEAIATEEEKKYQRLMTELDKIKSNEGRINAQHFWKIYKKLFLKSRDPPAAIYNKKRKSAFCRQSHRGKGSWGILGATAAKHNQSTSKCSWEKCQLKLKQTKKRNRTMDHGRVRWGC